VFTHPLAPDVDLRLIEDRHVQAVYDCVRRNLDHLSPWLPWATPEYSLEGCRANRRAVRERFARNDGFDAGIFVGGQFVGLIGYHGIDWGNRKTSIGYWLDAAHAGRGLMTLACRAFVRHALVDLNLNRVEIRCGVGNHRSRAIPQRLGFTEEGVARQAERIGERYVDLVVYSMLAGEWTSSTAR